MQGREKRFLRRRSSDVPHPVISALWGGATLVLVVGCMGWLGEPTLIASLAGSCVILFGMPASVMARPRSLFGGHLIASLIGVLLVYLFGPSQWTGIAGVAISLAAMIVTDTVHSPAGADPLIVTSTHAGWQFVFFPMLTALLLLFLASLLFNRLVLHQNVSPPDVER